MKQILKATNVTVLHGVKVNTFKINRETEILSRNIGTIK